MPVPVLEFLPDPDPAKVLTKPDYDKGIIFIVTVFMNNFRFCFMFLDNFCFLIEIFISFLFN